MNGFLALTQNPIVLTLIGLAVKYWPPLARVPNAALPYLNALIALLGGITASQAHPTSFMTAGFGDTLFGHLGQACWNAIQAALIYEVFGRHPLQDGLGWKKAK